MTRRFTKIALSLLLASSLTHVIACGSKEDLPFVFGDGSTGGTGSGSGSTNPPPPTNTGCNSNTDCTAPKTCDTSSHTCKTPASTGCTDNTGCTSPQICDTGTHTCKNPPSSGGCTDNSQCQSGQVCDTGTHTCGLPGACSVDFTASLALKIDDDFTAGHFDSPPKCCEYAGDPNSNQSTCPSLASGDSDSFLQAPSKNTDLFCCSSDSGNVVPGHPELFCDAENRHGGIPELAVTRWAANAGAKMRLKFAITNGGANCQVSIVRDLFPQFRLENTALDASLIIDAGKDYQNFPPNPTQKLNDDEITAPCAVTTDGSGNVQVAISSIPLRFMTQLFVNYAKCTQVDNLGPACPTGPFIRRYLGEAPGSFQIIPGFSNPALTLTTSDAHVDPTDAVNQPGGTMTAHGAPLHFDTSDNTTKMSLVAAFSMPPSSAGTGRDDNVGSGQLLAELKNAILTAEISGTVTRTNGQPIQTLADLTTNCGTGSGPGGGAQNLDLEMHSVYGTTDEKLAITGDPTKPAQPFTAEACVPGSHDGTNCKFFDPANLPFAKGTGDPAPGTESKFFKDGTLTIQSKSDSTVPLVLQVPSKVGAFEITNASALQNITLAPGNSTTLNVRFEPEVAASGCTSTGGLVNCQAALSLSSSNSVTVTLKGEAKVPAAEITLQEINTAAPNAVVSTILPATTSTPIDFGETLLGIQTKTKLYQLVNTGVRDLTVNDVQAQDVKRNFRVGSVFQGTDFQHRTWQIGHQPWTVPAAGNNNLFFFMSYGPFGKVGGTGSTRSDAGTLVLNTFTGVQSVNLTGSAKKDSRATLALYVEDASRFTVTGSGDPALKDISDGGTTKHFYLPKSELSSFRQDPATRAVYILNNGTAAGVDNLILQSIQFTADAGGKFVFTPDSNPQATACLMAAPDATAPCATLTASGDTNKIKLGMITFTPSTTGGYAVSNATLVVKSISLAAGSTGSGAPPIIGGHSDNTDTLPAVTFQLKGSSNAPQDQHDLKVHRLIAGFSKKINTGLQTTLIVSDATKGILQRFNALPAPDVNVDSLKDLFTLNGGITLNPVTGEATLKRIVTKVDTDPNNNPLSPSDPSFEGLRLYNAPGSTPGGTEYYAQCSTNAGHNCAFFYLYIGDWTGSTVSATCNGASKFPVISGYQEGNDAVNNPLFAQVMKPNVPAEYTCLSGASGMQDKQHGTYDPVTGEITFKDLAVRLFAPAVPAIGGNPDIDATIHLSLTTGCVTLRPDDQSLVPDVAARPQYLVPSNTLSDASFNATLMGPGGNPLLPYVDQAGTTCATRELHGRTMFAPDTTNTLDDPDFTTLNFQGFDLAGVGRNIASNASVSAANMYIVIKAEVMP